MDQSAPSPNQAHDHGEISPQLSETRTPALSGKKRSASDADIRDDSTAASTQKESAKDADAAILSSKRVRVDGSLTAGGVEMVDSKSSGPDSSQADQGTAEKPSKAHSGWNSGVSKGGLRTSFTSLSKDKLRKPSSQRASETPVPPPDSEAPTPPPAESPRATVTRDLGSLAMPTVSSDFLKRPGRGSTWQTRFVSWCVQLMTLNKDREGLQDEALLRDAWEFWLQTQYIQPVGRVAALRAATDTKLDAEKLQEMLSKSLEPESEGSQADSPASIEQSESPSSEQQSSNGMTPEGSKTASLGSQDPNEWALPELLSPSDFKTRTKDHRGWEEKFTVWCKALQQMNEGKVRAKTPRERNRIAESYLKWVGKIEGLSKGKAANARRAAVSFVQENGAQLAAIFSQGSLPDEPQATKSEPRATKLASLRSEDTTPSPSSGMVSTGYENMSSGSLDHGDAAYREKYFPGISPDETFCTMCASHSHDPAECPEMTCRFCHDPEHRSFSCPTRVRCTKCKQLGHVKEDCHEKLALPREERECALCQSHDHDDASCHELWRSFLPNPDTVRKVRSLPMFCYTCGRQGHFGPACGLNPQRSKESPWETWSQANCDRYLDPASTEVAIIYESSSGSALDAGYGSERPDLGKSIVPNRHIIFEEADDDDEAEDFIRAPVQKSARVGHISFSGNSGGGNRGGRRSNNYYNDSNARPDYTLPPLPPGPPPPPLPRQGYHQQGGRRNGGGGTRGRGGGRGRGNY